METESNMYNVGVERESLRCTKEGKLSDLPHPKIFGDRMENDFITTDFGEAQMELRTPICKNTEECYNKLENITDVVLCELNKRNELLWPYSMPCKLPKVEDFTFGDYGKYKEEAEYEMALYKKYGYKMHCISGIHVNFSFDKNFYKKMRLINKNIPADMDEAYFKIMRQFMKKAWILIYFLGATPLQCENGEKSKISIRNSANHGFGNGKQLEVDFNNREDYVNSIVKNLESGTILSARELYIPIRAKSKDKNNVVADLLHQKVDHIEVRLCDINPFDKCGVSKNDLDLVVAFLFYCLLTKDEYELNYREVAENGLTQEQKQKLLEILAEFKKINKTYKLKCDASIQEMLERCEKNSTKADEVLKISEKAGLINAILKLGNNYAKDSEMQKYFLKQYPKLEASTVAVIKDGISKGVDFDVINEDKHFVKLMHGTREECIIQATKTNKDSYIFPYITDDKYFAKEVMRKEHLNVPDGITINKKTRKRKKPIQQFYNHQVVIKPRTTNCGVGITVFSKPATEKQITKAINYAFQFDDDVLLEEYAEGREYRFIVIDGKCLNVVWRRSASVVGDGKSTIKELIDKKDQEPWHYLLDNPMVIDQPLKIFLKKHGHTFDDVPQKDERIFLRENSNCSTGGESVDVTNIMGDNFKKIAEKAARTFKAKICGVDILINDVKGKDYTVVEINDNPGICINEWPYEGKGERIGLHILKLLRLIS